MGRVVRRLRWHRTGSTAGYVTEPFVERNILYESRGQSLAPGYNNTGSFLDIDGKVVTATLSEANREFSPALDLTEGGATRLVLQVRSLATNTVEPTDNACLTLADGVKADEVLPRADDNDGGESVCWDGYLAPWSGDAAHRRRFPSRLHYSRPAVRNRVRSRLIRWAGKMSALGEPMRVPPATCCGS